MEGIVRLEEKRDIEIMKIKICGLTNLDDISYVNDAKVDYAGFVFFPSSKRNLTITQARKLCQSLDEGIKKVAVLVSPKVEDILEKQNAGFDVIQIHGKLTEDVLEAAKKPVWYAVNIEDESELMNAAVLLDNMKAGLTDKIEAILVDAKNFGSGKTFNWRKSKRLLKAGQNSPPSDDELVDRLFANREFILAGGLRADNIKEGIELFKPDIVDVSSSVEIDGDTVGKDKAKIDAFVTAVRDIGEMYE